ncbi:AlpA family transcriptional regulator [Agitococcus lubricus]|uniref:AlpA family transcriptional regulator n=1 Tax=Agitococcus lubricus TaxID=1077255 RepID=A0A2T5IXA7_9GAMM|nr:AlpA family transcriptional regulator [Agitococcus lubricus]PTQ88567.1 AlpA family transcriptional regulator [Agitococcus lubricus]
MIIMRLTDVMFHTGLGRSSIYKFIAAGTFPKPVPLGDRAVGWVKSEIEDWIMDKIEDRDKRLAAS